MYRPLVCLLVGILFVHASHAAKQPTLTRDDQSLTVTLPGGVGLRFALQGDVFLGLNAAEVGGMALTSEQTLLRPLIADEAYETDQPWVVHRMTLDEASVNEDGKVVLTLGLHASAAQPVIRQVYLWKGDTARALGDAITPELKAAKAKADAAQQLLYAAVDLQPDIIAAASELDAMRDRIENPSDEEKRRVGKLRRELKKMESAFAKARKAAVPVVAKPDDGLAKALGDVQAFRVLRDRHALTVGKIHRDYFGSAMFRLPAEANTLASAAALAKPMDDTFEVGTLRWVIEPASHNIAGWGYVGWKHHYELELAHGKTSRHVRETGTWELGGDPAGVTLVALRYRGLGGVDETLAAGPEGGVDRNFTTTEMIPGAAGGAPLISPIVPPGNDNNDRGFGIRHRVSPWIGRMSRGAGSAMFEFQHRPQGVFLSFPDRLMNLRAVTEVFNGDRAISQTNEEYFGRSSKLTTTPMFYLALRAPEGQPFALHECRTRWQEADRFTRDRISEELGFVQAEPLPGVGLNLDTAWEPRIKTLTDRMDRYAGMGMRMILVHHPGWKNGRGMRQSKIPELVEMTKAAGGGDCSIYDYVPRDTVGEQWKQLTRKLAENEVAYLVWSSYFSVGPGPFIQELVNEHGLGLEDFANYDNPAAMGEVKPIPQSSRVPHNPNHPVIRKAYADRIEQAAETWGHHGLWADSWQKWSILLESDAQRAPVYRAWLEQYAAWSRAGMAFVSEGHGSPLMSCSIELSQQKFEDEWWYLPHTTLWYRGNSKIPGYGTDAADQHTFRLMANKCWPFPETGWGQEPVESIPSFARLAHEYNAALPMMRRSFVLPDGAGVLWLGYADDQAGVWFAFKDGSVPDGIEARGVVDEQPAGRESKAFSTYAVSAEDLLAAFGLRRGELEDPRLGRTHQPMQYTWPQWAQEKQAD